MASTKFMRAEFGVCVWVGLLAKNDTFMAGATQASRIRQWALEGAVSGDLRARGKDKAFAEFYAAYLGLRSALIKASHLHMEATYPTKRTMGSTRCDAVLKGLGMLEHKHDPHMAVWARANPIEIDRILSYRVAISTHLDEFMACRRTLAPYLEMHIDADEHHPLHPYAEYGSPLLTASQFYYRFRPLLHDPKEP